MSWCVVRTKRPCSWQRAWHLVPVGGFHLQAGQAGMCVQHRESARVPGAVSCSTQAPGGRAVTPGGGVGCCCCPLAVAPVTDSGRECRAALVCSEDTWRRQSATRVRTGVWSAHGPPVQEASFALLGSVCSLWVEGMARLAALGRRAAGRYGGAGGGVFLWGPLVSGLS